MPRYVALLRAINVGGHTVEMKRLARLFEALRFDDVQTFIASGNVVFSSSSGTPRALETRIASHLEKALGYEVETFLRTPAQLATIATHRAFAKPLVDSTLYIGFLAAKPVASTVRQVAALAAPGNEFALHDRELYWRSTLGMGRNPITGAKLEKSLGQPTTLRKVTRGEVRMSAKPQCANAARATPAVLALLALATLLAAAPPAHEPRHYVFFGMDRERIHERAFLDTPAIAGAELKYSWRRLEPQPGVFALAPVLEDLEFLERHGKRLVLQLQDVSFDSTILVPPDLLTDPAYHGGIAPQFDEGAKGAPDRFAGFVARRWDPAVHARFETLLDTLGRLLDGRLEALVLPETSLDFGTPGKHEPAGFSPAAYAATIHARMRAAQRAFPRSGVIQYANFMPGEWLPWEDHGYLRSVYALAESLRTGVGGPDLLPHRRGQRQHSLPLLAARSSRVRAGLAVQDGNLAERDPANGRRVTVAELAAFARDSLRLDYVFWGTEEPYYTRDVLPWLHGRQAR